MSEASTNKSIFIASAVCVLYLFLTIFYYHIDKYLKGALFIGLTALIPLAFVAMAFFVIRGIIQAYNHRRELSFRLCLPLVIPLLTLTYTIFSPWKLDSESLESKVLLRACFEGTQNQAYIKLRSDKTFEINWTGAFGYDEWFLGTYTEKSDTFYLYYNTERPYRFGDTIVNNGESLEVMNKLKKDSSEYFVPFYLGYCKGLN